MNLKQAEAKIASLEVDLKIREESNDEWRKSCARLGEEKRRLETRCCDLYNRIRKMERVIADSFVKQNWREI
jgi:hypothetical protein